MASLAEVGFSVRNQVRGGFSPDDERLDIELIYHIIINVRNNLIREWYYEKYLFDPSMFQNICCLEVKCRKVVCNGIESGDVEYYVDNLPSFMDLPGAIIYVGTVDRLRPARAVASGVIYGISNSQYAPNVFSYSRIGDEMILYNLPTEGLKFICITAVLDDPVNLGCYRAKEGEEFPFPGHLLHKLELLAIKQLLSTPVTNPKMPADEINNAKNDT